MPDDPNATSTDPVGGVGLFVGLSVVLEVSVGVLVFVVVLLVVDLVGVLCVVSLCRLHVLLGTFDESPTCGDAFTIK